MQRTFALAFTALVAAGLTLLEPPPTGPPQPPATNTAALSAIESLRTRSMLLQNALSFIRQGGFHEAARSDRAHRLRAARFGGAFLRRHADEPAARAADQDAAEAGQAAPGSGRRRAEPRPRWDRLFGLRAGRDRRRLPRNLGEDPRRLEPRVGAAHHLRAAAGGQRLPDLQRFPDHQAAGPGAAEHLGLQLLDGDLQVGRSSTPSSSARKKKARAYGESEVRARTSSQSICSRRVRAISSTL